MLFATASAKTRIFAHEQTIGSDLTHLNEYNSTRRAAGLFTDAIVVDHIGIQALLVAFNVIAQRHFGFGLIDKLIG